MRRRWMLLVLPAAAFLAPARAGIAQQEPIFGCRHAISCRNSPIGLSALNDPGASGLLVNAGIRWGPGFHFGLSMPLLNLPGPKPEAAIDIHAFHLYNVTLLPTPEPTPPPASPTPPPSSPPDPR